MDSDDDVVVVIGECFVDGVVYDFEYYVVQIGIVGGVVDVYVGLFVYGFKIFELCD